MCEAALNQEKERVKVLLKNVAAKNVSVTWVDMTVQHKCVNPVYDTEILFCTNV